MPDEFIQWRRPAPQAQDEAPSSAHVDAPTSPGVDTENGRVGSLAAEPEGQATAEPVPRQRGGRGALALSGVAALTVVGAVLYGTGHLPGQQSTAAPVAATPSATGMPTATGSRTAGVAPTGAAATSSSATAAPAAPTDATNSTPTSAPATAKSSPTASVSDDLVRLQALQRADAPGIVLDSRYVAMLSAKAEGIVDKVSPPPGGGAWHWPAIYAQHMALRTDPRFGSSVRLLLSTQFGDGTTTKAGKPYYVTIADLGFSSADDVKSWCDSTFSDLSATQRANACAPGRLRPLR